jgi:hypothetical protein
VIYLARSMLERYGIGAITRWMLSFYCGRSACLFSCRTTNTIGASFSCVGWAHMPQTHYTANASIADTQAFCGSIGRRRFFHDQYARRRRYLSHLQRHTFLLSSRVGGACVCSRLTGCMYIKSAANRVAMEACLRPTPVPRMLHCRLPCMLPRMFLTPLTAVHSFATTSCEAREHNP